MAVCRFYFNIVLKIKGNQTNAQSAPGLVSVTGPCLHTRGHVPRAGTPDAALPDSRVPPSALRLVPSTEVTNCSSPPPPFQLHLCVGCRSMNAMT